MIPEEMQLVTMLGVGLAWSLAAWRIGFKCGRIEGRADNQLWTRSEYNRKARSND